jgi:hypothetical protein
MWNAPLRFARHVRAMRRGNHEFLSDIIRRFCRAGPPEKRKPRGGYDPGFWLHQWNALPTPVAYIAENSITPAGGGQVMLRNIVDGWALNASIEFLPFRALPMQLGQLEPLRRAHNFRERIWVLPDDLTIAIPARGQLNRQIRITPGSWLWGGTFYKFDNSDEEHLYNPVAPAGLSVQITDDATGCQFGSEFILANCLYPDGGFASPALLAQPRLFVRSGLLSVEIANLNDVDVNCQLQLCFSEPCELREGAQCP